MRTPNINWLKLGAALAPLSPYGPFFGPDGAIYAPDGTTLLPPSDGNICHEAGSTARERGNAWNRTRRGGRVRGATPEARLTAPGPPDFASMRLRTCVRRAAPPTSTRPRKQL